MTETNGLTRNIDLRLELQSYSRLLLTTSRLGGHNMDYKCINLDPSPLVPIASGLYLLFALPPQLFPLQMHHAIQENLWIG